MSDNEDDRIKIQYSYKYYYEPLGEGGKYQTKFREAGDLAGRMIYALSTSIKGNHPQFAVAAAMGGILGNIIGNVGAIAGDNVGQVIDNIPTIERNINTALDQLNDPGFWLHDSDF